MIEQHLIDVNMEIISRKEAKKKGLKRYFTGVTCTHGHVTERLTSNTNCTACNREYIKANRQKYYPPEKVHEYYVRHKPDRNARSKKWAEENPEKVKETHKQWRDRNPEKLKEWDTQKRLADPQKSRDRLNNWRKGNPAKTRLQKHRRRMLEQTAGGEYTQDDIEAILMAQKGLCVGCGCDIMDTFTIDHKTPLSRGGTNDPENIQGLCLGCNSSKGTKTNEEWIRDRSDVFVSV